MPSAAAPFSCRAPAVLGPVLGRSSGSAYQRRDACLCGFATRLMMPLFWPLPGPLPSLQSFLFSFFFPLPIEVAWKQSPNWRISTTVGTRPVLHPRYGAGGHPRGAGRAGRADRARAGGRQVHQQQLPHLVRQGRVQGVLHHCSMRQGRGGTEPRLWLACRVAYPKPELLSSAVNLAPSALANRAALRPEDIRRPYYSSLA